MAVGAAALAGQRHETPCSSRSRASRDRTHIGWHTFRHTFSSVLKANGEDVRVVQEFLRHANSRITQDTYTQAMTPAEREAQSKIVQMILPTRKTALDAANAG